MTDVLKLAEIGGAPATSGHALHYAQAVKDDIADRPSPIAATSWRSCGSIEARTTKVNSAPSTTAPGKQDLSCRPRSGGRRVESESRRGVRGATRLILEG